MSDIAETLAISKYTALGHYDSNNHAAEKLAHVHLEPRKPITFGPSGRLDHTHPLAALLQKNETWAKSVVECSCDFFERGALGQRPEILWIGCADSRVPECEILQLAPGDVFTHRNIANVVVNTDLNCLSVLQYAVDVLKVKHIIVCGHYGCGGVAAALGDRSYGLIDHWLLNVKNVKQQHAKGLDSLDVDEEKCRALVELNARQSVLNVAQSPILRAAWERGQEIDITGLVYDIKTGLLGELGYYISSPEDLAKHEEIQSSALFSGELQKERKHRWPSFSL
ncbi:hypothetical protein BGW42_004806 [Actinomortierella wolfii]|nr:hypothetical protein BGW42_004806 [Actinomortierella wolfii]